MQKNIKFLLKNIFGVKDYSEYYMKKLFQHIENKIYDSIFQSYDEILRRKYKLDLRTYKKLIDLCLFEFKNYEKSLSLLMDMKKYSIEYDKKCFQLYKELFLIPLETRNLNTDNDQA